MREKRGIVCVCVRGEGEREEKMKACASKFLIFKCVVFVRSLLSPRLKMIKLMYSKNAVLKS